MKHKIGSLSEFSGKNSKVAEISNKMIAVFKTSNGFYAIDDTCTHAGASLSEGQVEGNEVECPWHGARFNITTGEALTMPATQPVTSYKIAVEDGDLYIEL
ncbi:MAG: non-heme iron oxygenase ferredoxin subunit [Planctomycetes bacterium]|nr:non-heme iron oxygenase ferredoxin subunit [Planctomycetota bacterium]